jgi:rubrerythrin
MVDNRLNEIIDFAIEREKEAVDFYHKLQKRAEFTHQKEALEDLENMERGHIQILENIREKDMSEAVPEDVPDLKISDYLVQGDLSADMSYQDILITAMKREEKSHDLYTRLAAEYKDENVQNLFKKLASEEAKHKLHFETIYDNEILKED